LESLRARPYQTAGSITSVALASAALLAAVGIHTGIGPEPTLQRLMIGLWASGLTLCVAGIAFFVVALEQYVEVQQRTQDYGILKVLGASFRHFVNLLALESLLIAVPGSAVGIVFSYAAKAIVILAFSRDLTLSIVYWTWPVVALFSFASLMLGGLIAVRSTLREGVEEALSYHK